MTSRPASSTKLTAVDTSVRALLPDVQTVAQIANGVRLIGPDGAAAFAVTEISTAKGASPGSDAGKMIVTATLTASVLAGTVTPDSAQVFVLSGGAWKPAPDHRRDVVAAVIRVVIDDNWAVPTLYQLVLSGGGGQPILTQP